MSNLENFLPKQDEPVFIVYWRGRKDINCNGFWHSPGIMDGGYIISYTVKEGICRVGFSKDGFAFSTLIEEVEFNIEKCKEYEIYIINKHIVVPGVELTTDYISEGLNECKNS